MSRQIWRISMALAVALASVLASLLTGCSVGGQRHAVEIPNEDLPSVLSEPSASSPAASVSPSIVQSPSSASSSLVTSPPPSSEEIVTPTSTIYLVDDRTDKLVAVHRPRTQTATLTGLVQSLLSGPTAAESAAGLATAINTSPTLNKISTNGSLATIDLSASFGEIRGPGEVLATAQVVMTAASFPGIDSVLFSLDGTPTSVPLVSGELSSAPLTFSDYATLLAGATLSSSPSPSPSPSP
jgi:spore germination protein GerM